MLRHIRAIAAEAKQELMNAFRRELTLKLVAVSLDKSPSDAKRPPHQNKTEQKRPTSDGDRKLTIQSNR